MASVRPQHRIILGDTPVDLFTASDLFGLVKQRLRRAAEHRRTQSDANRREPSEQPVEPAGSADPTNNDHLSGFAASTPLAIASANLDHIYHFAQKGISASTVDLDGANPRWLVLLDGVPLVKKAASLTGTSWPQLAGSDILPNLIETAESVGARVGFLGGQPEMHALLAPVLTERFPNLLVSGMWAPQRTELNDPAAAARIAETIRDAETDLLVVGLGKPRQERWIQQYATASGASVLLAFGASADFMAGTVQRAPQWMRRYCLEWLYRFGLEPRRLAHRYLVEAPTAMRRLLTGSAAVYPALRGTPGLGAEQANGCATGVAGAAADGSAQGRPADCGVVIVAYRSAESVCRLLDSLPAAAAGLSVRVVVVDNDSGDDIAARLAARSEGASPAGAVAHSEGASAADTATNSDGESVESPEPLVELVEAGANLGYAGAINLGRRRLGPVRSVLVLNPDLRLRPGCVRHLFEALGQRGAAAAVPQLIGSGGETFRSLRREPTPLRALGEALLGDHWPSRPASLSEMVRSAEAYRQPGTPDWATGAAIMVTAEADAMVGDWDSERFFLYAEETDYLRRVRDLGGTIRYVPAAVAMHSGGGSGGGPDLVGLNVASRIRYYAKYNGAVATAVFRLIALIEHGLRATRPGSRRAMRALIGGLDRAYPPGRPIATAPIATAPSETTPSETTPIGETEPGPDIPRQLRRTQANDPQASRQSQEQPL